MAAAVPTMAEMTAQIISLTDQIATLTNRLAIAEQNVAAVQTNANTGTGGGTNNGKDGVFDKKRLYPKELKQDTSFRSWSERVISWLTMDNEEIARAFHRAGRQEDPLNLTGLTTLQLAYNKAIYGHLRGWTENYRKAARIVRLVKHDNGLEAWRRLTRKFDPQSAEVHAARLESIITFGGKN